jgi:integrase/recombinase XerD
MANFKIVFYRSKIYKDKTSPVLLRVIIDRKPKYFTLPDNFKCLPTQWDKTRNQFKYTYPNYKKANQRLLEALSKAGEIAIELNKKNTNEGFNHSEFGQMFKKETDKLFLFDYFDEIYNRLMSINKIGNATAYIDAKRQFAKHFNIDIEMSKVTLKHLNIYVESCRANGQKDTSISVRMRTLRALFNKARIEENLENYPFEKFNWKQFNLETEKRAISKPDILKIYNHKLEPGQPFFDSKNYFLFMYLSSGLNFGDLAKLEPENIVSDEEQKMLNYRRSKTRKLLEVSLTDYSLQIIDYYKNSNFGNKYIFPILNPEIHQTPKQIRTRIQTALKLFNKEIRELAQSLGIAKHITSYVARHSFATILKKENVETAIISEMMGHSSESVTQTYLDSFDNSTKTEAAKKLM